MRIEVRLEGGFGFLLLALFREVLVGNQTGADDDERRARVYEAENPVQTQKCPVVHRYESGEQCTGIKHAAAGVEPGQIGTRNEAKKQDDREVDNFSQFVAIQ